MKPTIHFGADVIDGDAFFARCNRTATALAGLGIGPRTVVALMLRNEPVMLELMMAARWLGALWCPINWHFKTAEVRHMLVDSGARALIVHADLLPQIEGALPDGLPVFVVEAHAHTQAAGHIDDPMPPLARRCHAGPTCAMPPPLRCRRNRRRAARWSTPRAPPACPRASAASRRHPSR
jgi:long-chain acyl-CoA synthetase